MIRYPECRHCGEEIDDPRCICYGDLCDAFLSGSLIYHISCVKHLFRDVEESDVWIEAIEEAYESETPKQEFNEDDLIDSDAEWFG